MNALALFKAGNDYIQIAALLHTSEAEVEKEIHRLRNEERERVRKRENRRRYQQAWQQARREDLRKVRASA